MEALPYRTVGRSFAQAASREEWLNSAWSIFADVAEAEGHTIPQIQFAVGYGPRGFCKGVEGETWAKALAQGTYTVFVDPQCTDPINLLRIVSHEGAHAVDDLVSQHRSGSRFAKLVELFGLVGPYTSTPIGDHARGWFGEIVRALGRYPHSKFTPVGTRGTSGGSTLPGGGRTSTGRPKQGTYMVKFSCEGCGFIGRATAKWLDTVGAPSCACGHGQMVVG